MHNNGTLHVHDNPCGDCMTLNCKTHMRSPWDAASTLYDPPQAWTTKNLQHPLAINTFQAAL